jgi:urease accessory protein
LTADAPRDFATLHLLAWLSPAFPVGAFAYSHGLEAAVEGDEITDAVTLRAWLADLIEHGSLRNDAILASEAYSAAEGGALGRLREVNELALAMSPARERRLETQAMGTAFCSAIRAAWADAAASFLPERDVAYPVAFGAACAAQGLSRLPCLEGFGLAFVQNLVSAAVRLGPIGQTEGQRVTAALLPAVRDLAALAADSTLDDLGGCAFRSDLAAMRHETLYSRLFRS